MFTETNEKITLSYKEEKDFKPKFYFNNTNWWKECVKSVLALFS